MFDDVQRILVVKLSSIGDVVHSLPVLAALRRRFPRAFISWAVGPAAADIVTDSPYLDEALIVGGADRGPHAVGVPPLSAPRRLAHALRQRRFDLTLDMQGLFRSALLARLTGAPRRVGFRNLQEGAFLLNNLCLVPDRRDCHAVEGYLGFARALGAPAEPLDFTIATSDDDRAAVERLLGSGSNIAALVPGARWPSKRWPPARFAAVADALAGEFGATVAVTGAAEDGPIAREIASAARAPVLDLTGRTTLKQLAEVFRRCRVVIANDTGPMHIAAAVGAPTVALFGPTDARRLGPYGDGNATVAADLSCAPCRRRQCAPLKCMGSIQPARVLEAVRRVIRNPTPEDVHGRP